MRKILVITLLIAICFSLVTCGGKDDEELYAERSIDGIAECLGYTDGEEILEPWEVLPGALAAKDFADGEVSIYEFIPESADFKEMQRQSAICNDGFVLMLGNGMPGAELADLIVRFEKIKFE